MCSTHISACYTIYISHIHDSSSLFRTGTAYSYSLHQLSLWAIFYMALLFWAVVCPFHYQSFRNAGCLKYVYTSMTIAGVLLPCVPAGVNLVFGHQVISFSPMVCLVAVQDVGFYTCTDALLGAFNVAILGTLQALVFWTLVKVCLYRTKSSLSNIDKLEGLHVVGCLGKCTYTLRLTPTMACIF